MGVISTVYAHVVRYDPLTGLFLSLADVLMDIQPIELPAPEVIGESFFVSGSAYTPHKGYTAGPGVPDVRLGDGVIDPGDNDPATGNPSVYDVAFVVRWTSHLVLSLRKAVQSINVLAMNNRTLANYGQGVLLLRKIRVTDSGTPLPTTSRDAVRHQSVSFQDGTYGDGYQNTDPVTGQVRNGYYAAVPTGIAINDKVTQSNVTGGGLSIYEKPLAYATPPLVLGKGDVLIWGVIRYVVEDDITPLQVYGVTVLQIVTLEKRSLDNFIYALPL